MNILLLQIKRIGDLILTTPAIAALRERFPGARLTLVVSRDGAPLLSAIAGIDQSFVVLRKWSDLKIFRTISRDHFNYCIDLTGNDRSALLTYLSRAEKRIASSWLRVQSKRRGLAYNEFVPDRVGNLHTVDFHLSLIESLGIHNASPKLRLDLPRSACDDANLLLRQAEIENEFVIFHPGSARAEKLWDPQRWANVIENVPSNQQLTVVLTGGSTPLEQTHLAEIKRRLRRSVVDLTGKIDLLTLTALIQKARLVITVDSAPMHLAAAMQTPQVVLFGPTNPFHWRPRSGSALVLQGTSPVPVTEFFPKQARHSMNDISTKAVIDAMSSLLSTPAAQLS